MSSLYRINDHSNELKSSRFCRLLNAHWSSLMREDRSYSCFVWRKCMKNQNVTYFCMPRFPVCLWIYRCVRCCLCPWLISIVVHWASGMTIPELTQEFPIPLTAEHILNRFFVTPGGAPWNQTPGTRSPWLQQSLPEAVRWRMFVNSLWKYFGLKSNLTMYEGDSLGIIRSSVFLVLTYCLLIKNKNLETLCSF